MRIIRSLLALAVVVGAFGMPVAMAPAGAAALPAVDEPTDAAPLSVSVVPAASGVIAPGADLVLAITLSNRSAATVPAGVAGVGIDRSVAGGGDDLSGWLEATETDAGLGDPLVQVPTPQLLAGETVELAAIVVPAASLGFDPAARFGAHKVQVRITAGDEVFGEARTSITANPGTGFQSTPLALALPLTVPASSSGLISADLLETYTSTDGILGRQLDQAYNRPIALGLDPRIIASIRILGDSAPESATAWLARLESASNETFPLTYADTDLAATSQAGGGVLAPTGFEIDPDLFTDDDAPGATPSPDPSGGDTTVDPAVPTLETLLEWDYTLPGIAWPRDSTVIATDLDAFATAGLTTTILASGNSSVGSLEATPGAAATIGGHQVVTSDSRISARLREAVFAPTDVEWQSAMTKLTASLATLAAEDDVDPRIVLATTGRGSPLGGFRLAQTLAALATLPWSSPAGFGAATAQQPTDATLVDAPVAADRLGLLQSLLASEAAVGQFATVLSDPASVTDERRLDLLALASQSWTITDTGWPAAVDEYLADSNEILSSVSVVESSTITLLADKGELPITISNSLDSAVTVYVTVTASTAVLAVLDPRVEVTVEANSQKQASVPVESIANGEVTIAISLTSATGVGVGQPNLTDLNVQAGWETAATTVLAVIVVVLFVLGIVRTIRRRRRLAAEGTQSDPKQTGDGQADDETPVTAEARE